jgi:hypothetical protein
MIWYDILLLKRNTCMKKLPNQNPAHNTQFNTHKRRPENKDNLDSREGEEQQFKGDDVTHNRKEHQAKKGGQKTKDPKGRH